MAKKKAASTRARTAAGKTRKLSQARARGKFHGANVRAQLAEEKKHSKTENDAAREARNAGSSKAVKRVGEQHIKRELKNAKRRKKS